MEYNIKNRKTWKPEAERAAMRYDQGLWSKPMLKVAVIKGILSKEEFAEVTGEQYK